MAEVGSWPVTALVEVGTRDLPSEHAVGVDDDARCPWCASKYHHCGVVGPLTTAIQPPGHTHRDRMRWRTTASASIGSGSVNDNVYNLPHFRSENVASLVIQGSPPGYDGVMGWARWGWRGRRRGRRARGRGARR